LNAIFTENFYEYIEIKGDSIIEHQKLLGHTSLTYASDWQGNTLITTSFYDKIVKLWQLI
jgi:hypothetical protein